MFLVFSRITNENFRHIPIVERKKNKDTQFKLREKGKGSCGAKIYNGNKGRFNKFVKAWNLLEK